MVLMFDLKYLFPNPFRNYRKSMGTKLERDVEKIFEKHLWLGKGHINLMWEKF